MSKRNYPLVLIDRTKDKAHPYIFVTVMDQNVGFVARVLEFWDDESYKRYLERPPKYYNSFEFKRREGGLVLVVEDFLSQQEADLNNQQLTRINSLLKRAMKKVIHGEIDRAPDFEDLGVDNQIQQQISTIDNAKNNYKHLVERENGDDELVDYQIALAEATLETLKNWRDNQNFINLN